MDITYYLGFCGVMSLFSSMRYCLGPPSAYSNLWAALGFMPFGLFFDFMDGKVARWRNKSSLMGQELDSLADLVRFLPFQRVSIQCAELYIHICKRANPNRPRSPSASRPPQQPSPSASARPSTISCLRSSCSAASRVSRASTSPLPTSRKTRRARANTSRARRSPPRWRSRP